MSRITRHDIAAGPVTVIKYHGGKIIERYTLPAPGDSDVPLRLLKHKPNGRKPLGPSFTAAGHAIREELANKK